MQHKWDVFLSYSSKDKIICSIIKADLEAKGFKCWHDMSILAAGKRVREEIQKGIRESACIVIILSNNSLRSRWVLNELDAAMLREIHERRVLVIPVLIGRVQHKVIPTDLLGKQYIDLRFNFPKRYSSRKTLLLRSVALVALRQTRPSRHIGLLGAPAMSFLFSVRYDNTQVGKVSDAGWKGFIEVLTDPSFWSVEFEQAALETFRTLYGHEGIKRVLMFSFHAKRIDLASGFTEAELNDAMDEARWFILVSATHEYARQQGFKGIEVSINKKNEFLYRLVK